MKLGALMSELRSLRAMLALTLGSSWAMAWGSASRVGGCFGAGGLVAGIVLDGEPVGLQEVDGVSRGRQRQGTQGGQQRFADAGEDFHEECSFFARADLLSWRRKRA